MMLSPVLEIPANGVVGIAVRRIFNPTERNLFLFTAHRLDARCVSDDLDLRPRTPDQICSIPRSNPR